MNTENSDDDDIPCLSANSIAALQEHYSEQNRLQQIHSVYAETGELLKGNNLIENWQFSQFWYDDDTAKTLVMEALEQISREGTVALIGCPSLYYFFRKEATDPVRVVVKLLEIDRRFEAYKSDFFYYDYNLPLPPHVPEEWESYFDIVIIDPPFLSEECLEKCSQTAKFLTKKKVIVCTGAVMEKSVARLLNAERTNFQPSHRNNLGNDFACYINFESDRFNKL